MEGIKRNRYQDGGRLLYKEMYKVSTGQTTIAAIAADNTFQIVLRAQVLNKYAPLVRWKNLYCCKYIIMLNDNGILLLLNPSAAAGI